MSKILVTGGTGLVGRAIQNERDLRGEWMFLSSKDCDLLNFEKTLVLFKKFNPDYVVHLAAAVGGLFKNQRAPVEMFEKNIQINSNVLKCAHICNVKKLVACLSTCIFPNKVVYPIKEGYLFDGPPHDSNFAYAYAKRMLDVQCRTYRQQYNRNFVCIIPTNVYGPYDNFSLEDGHVIPALIHKCFLAKRKNIPLQVCGTGKPERQFIYSCDLARLILWVLFDRTKQDSIILAPNENDSVSIKRVTEMIAGEFDYANAIHFDKDLQKDGQFKKPASNEKIAAEIPTFVFTPLSIGIKNTVKWFIQNYPNVRL